MLSLIIATDVELYRHGLEEILGRQQGVTVVATAADSPTALRETVAHLPDVVLIDITMSQSVALVREIIQQGVETRVVMLGVGDSDGQLIQAAESGAVAFVTRDASLGQLVAVIRSVREGEFPCTPRVAGWLLRRVASLANYPCPPGVLRPLTLREVQILRFIQEGLSNKEIARRLGIEVATVKNHVHHVLEKLQVHRRADATISRLRAFPEPGSPSPS